MLSLDDIRAVIDDYRHAARCALDAGFDGVELHGANGYLPDQFLRDGVNQRTDRYGGPVHHRARFHLEAFQALADVWGSHRVGVRLSPSGSYADLNDSDPRATFSFLIRELGRLRPAYLHLMEAVPAWQARSRAELPGYEPIPVRDLRPLFEGVLIVNGGFDYASASRALREGWADAVAFGTLFISNPDLTARFRRLAAGDAGTPFNTPDESTYYTPGEKGYTDYPTLGGSAARG
jgi:N-ethylmaleimide reductase